MEDIGSQRLATGDPFTATEASCSCGAGPHPEHPGRCAAGHVLRNNGLALFIGVTSVAFWQQHAAARREIAEAIIRDAGFAEDDAPRALQIAADGVAQAKIVRDASYIYMAEAGGPFSSSGKARRVFAVWVAAMDRLERQLRLVGLERKTRPVPSVTEIMAAAKEQS